MGDNVILHHGDALDVLATLPDCSADAVVTDPPYALGFMGQAWDTHTPGGFQHWCELWAAECLRILKPGGHLLAFGGTRTYHRLAAGIEDAGFEIRDSLHWIYGSGFPKSLDVSKAIDKAAGVTREASGVTYRSPDGYNRTARANAVGAVYGRDGREWNRSLTAPATDEARRWQGWGTALKPAHEPIVLARKPLAGTVAANVQQYGTGALNIDATRVRPSGVPVLPAGADAPARDSLPCTCAELPACSSDDTGPARESSQPHRSPRTLAVGRSALQPGERSDPSASGVRDGNESRPPQGSPAGCRPSLRSGGEPARTVEVAAPASPQPLAGAGTSRGLRATPGRNPVGLSKPCPKHTTRDVECTSGRWPANVLFDGEAAQMLDEQSGNRPVGGDVLSEMPSTIGYGGRMGNADRASYRDSGGASRFFPVFRYQAKAGTRERPDVDGVKHPTVKPLELMRWLVRLVTPPGGTVLDPFAGSGTTAEACEAEGFSCVAIEREAAYLPLIRERIRRQQAKPAPAEHPQLTLETA